MRTTVEIVADAKDGEVPSHEECFWAMLALSGKLHFANRDLERVIENKEEPKKLKFMMDIMYKDVESLRIDHYNFLKKSPIEWLGDSGNPFSESTKKFREMGKKIIKNATGMDLD